MRSKRSSRQALKAEAAALRLELERQCAMHNKQCTPGGETPAAPIIAAGGFPLRSEPAAPKSLKEAKQLLMSMREW